jgi:hypothetical protein
MKLNLAVIFLLLSLAGCSTLKNSAGAVQPVVLKDAKNNIFFTTCSGSVEDWSTCHSKAQHTCPKGYDELERSESPIGGKRELTFGCH